MGDSTQHIARISYGKDSLKMLEVIKSRGLPLDRITTTEVWATDTISANLPEMAAFKERMDQRIWDMYRIEVEHLCARNPDGTKKTYEQLFYHVPVRRSQSVQVERERETDSGRNDSRLPRFVESVVPSWTQKDFGKEQSGDFQEFAWSTGAKNSSWSRINGFPAQISPWCRKLKIDKVKTPFPMSAPRGAKTEISWNTSGLQLTSRSGLRSSTRRNGHRWLSLGLMKVCAACIASMRTCCHQPMKHPAVMAAGSATIRE